MYDYLINNHRGNCDVGFQKSVVFQLKNVREKGIKIEENDLLLFFRLGKCVRSYNLQR